MKKMMMALAIVTSAYVARDFSRASEITASAAEARPSFAEAGISPVGSTIAFVGGGDIW